MDDSILKGMESKGVGRTVVSFGSSTSRLWINFTDPNKQTADGERSSIQFPNPFLPDRRVRQAIDLAVDREKMAAIRGRAGRATANVLVSPSIYNSPHTTHTFDLKKAAALLDEAGWIDSDGDGIRDKLREGRSAAIARPRISIAGRAVRGQKLSSYAWV